MKYFILLLTSFSLLLNPVYCQTTKNEKESSNELISLELKNIDVVEVIKILSRKGKINIVIGPQVRGRVTMFLNEVGIEDALYAVLGSANLAHVYEKNIMKIMTNKEFESNYGHPYQDKRSLTIIPVKHASATDLAVSLSKLKPQAIIIVDERTNSLLIKDSDENIEDVKKAISEIDKKVVTQNIEVKHLTKVQTEELIGLLLSKKGSFYFNTAINQVVIKDFPENVEKIAELLKIHDIPTKILTKSYSLDYGNFEEIEKKLKIILTPELGNVVTDERTNKILVTDLENKFPQIEKLIKECDQKDRQVLIEAKIVQVILNDRFQWGINWQTIINEINGSNLGLRLMNAYDFNGDLAQGIGFAESINAISNVPSLITEGSSFSDSTTTTTSTDIDNVGNETTSTNMVHTVTNTTETPTETETTNTPFNSNISYPKDGGGRIIATGTIEGRQFEGVLNALKTVGETKVLSSPRIITLSNEEAKIQVASKEAYVTSTTVTPGSGPSTTSENVTFLDVGISLSVTPVINKDRFITISVKPSISNVTATITTASGNQIPIVSTQEVESKIQVKNGVTIVLGGLHEQVTDKVQSRIPFLGAIPLIGILFKKIDNRIKNSELVMFLTPHIITGDKNFFDASDIENVSENVSDFLDENEIYTKARDYENNQVQEEE